MTPARVPTEAGERIRVLRVIARLNAGGPAYHVTVLSGGLDPARYQTLLVAGRVGAGEESRNGLAQRYGAHLRTITELGQAVDPRADLKALSQLVRIARCFRPHIVHTHTAKAGFLGRLAARFVTPRPIVVHTYHGHVLEGYFGGLKSRVFRLMERAMARTSDRLIGVSQATVDDLIRLGVAPRENLTVVPVGLHLEPFVDDLPDQGSGFRALVGCRESDVLVTYVGRLVPIKRLDVAIEAIALARRAGAPVRLAIVGDGECRGALEKQRDRLGLADEVSFVGYRTDLRPIIAGTDIAVLSSDNEGTPVSLIEAAAGGRPAVATAVGGVADVVTPDSGFLVGRGDPTAMARAIRDLAGDASLRDRMGENGRVRVRGRYAASRLLSDIDRLYVELLSQRGWATPRSGA